MFEKIPASNKSPDSYSLSVGQRRSHVPLLAPIIIKPSRWLWRAQLAIHGLLGLLFILALAPLIARNIIWMFLLLTLISLLLINLLVQRKTSKLIPKILSYSAQGWLLTESGGEQSVRIVGEVVVWSWLVILRLKDNAQNSVITLVLLPDSVSSENLRILRVWLRTQVGRNRAR